MDASQGRPAPQPIALLEEGERLAERLEPARVLVAEGQQAVHRRPNLVERGLLAPQLADERLEVVEQGLCKACAELHDPGLPVAACRS